MNTRRWTVLTAGLIFAALFTLALAVILIDPFQIYHPARHFIPPLDNTTQVYSNAGVVRSYDYDSAIVGTSVTENFRPTYMDMRLGGRFIKLCTSAGTAYNHALLLRLAFRTHSMRRVVYGLDVYSLIGELNKTGSTVPLYLYNDTVLDDAPYWLSRSVFASFLPRCLRTWGQAQDDSIRDSMYCWAGRDDYGRIALYNAEYTKPKLIQPADVFKEKALANLETHLIPFIREHPETQFDIFFPPYSAAEWCNMASRGTLDAMLYLRRLSYDRLTGYSNVTIYDFQTREDWVLNLDNYKDTTHYGQWINDAITDSIAAGERIIHSASEIDASNDILRFWGNSQLDAGKWIF